MFYQDHYLYRKVASSGRRGMSLTSYCEKKPLLEKHSSEKQGMLKTPIKVCLRTVEGERQ